jgi:hypothetical protein
LALDPATNQGVVGSNPASRASFPIQNQRLRRFTA